MAADKDTNRIRDPEVAEKLLQAKLYQQGDCPAFPDLFPDIVQPILKEEKRLREEAEREREAALATGAAERTSGYDDADEWP